MRELFPVSQLPFTNINKKISQDQFVRAVNICCFRFFCFRTVPFGEVARYEMFTNSEKLRRLPVRLLYAKLSAPKHCKVN